MTTMTAALVPPCCRSMSTWPSKKRVVGNDRKRKNNKKVNGAGGFCSFAHSKTAPRVILWHASVWVGDASKRKNSMWVRWLGTCHCLPLHHSPGITNARAYHGRHGSHGYCDRTTRRQKVESRATPTTSLLLFKRHFADLVSVLRYPSPFHALPVPREDRQSSQ